MRLKELSFHTILLACSSVAAGCFLALMADLWWKTFQPVLMTVENIEVTDMPEGDRVMLVTSSGPPSKDCIRFTQHLIYRDEDVRPPDSKHPQSWILRDYVPLGMAVNGIGFSSVSDFRVTLYVPPRVDRGVWNYVSRSIYMCTVFPGFARFSESASRPYQIHLD